MLINLKKRSQISRILFRIYKKLWRFNFISKNLYLLLLFFKFFYIDNDSMINLDRLDRLDVLEIENKKYYYLLIFWLIKNYLLLSRTYHNLDLEIVMPCLIYKNKDLLIYLENYYRQGNYLRIKNDFFFKKRRLSVFLHQDYKFRIDLFSFIFHGKYMEYIRKCVYNEYLTFVPILREYPLLKTFLRLIVYHRLDKQKDNHINSSSQEAILRKYHIYDDFSRFKINTSIEMVSHNSHYSQDLISTLVNSNLMKFIALWRNKKFYFYLDYVFSKFTKFNVILPAYHINLFYGEDEDLTDTNKYNMKGVYSIYWQMNRYGFEFNYYYYMNSIISCVLNSNLNNINCYNLYYLKFILSPKAHGHWIYWYKLIKLILLDYIYKSFFKFWKSNNLNKKKKKLRFKRLLSLKYVLQNYSFVFLPLNLNLYYDDNLLLELLEKKKYSMEEIVMNIYFGYRPDYCIHLNYSMINIYKKINLDNLLFNNMDYFLNIYLFFISKKIGKFYFKNFLAQFNGIQTFLLKLVPLKKINYARSKDLYLLKSRNYLDFNFSENKGINYFHRYRKLNLEEYLFDFEFIFIYSFYLIIIFKYNQLYLKIFIGKFLLYGIN